MAKKNAAAPTTAATTALGRAGIPFVPHAYAHDPAVTDFGSEAAEVLGIDPARVFKTLMVDTDAGLGIGIVPVSGMLDLKALASSLGRATREHLRAGDPPGHEALGNLGPPSRDVHPRDAWRRG